MRNIYTSIDVGSDSVKVLVAEIIQNKLNVLAAISKESKGIRKGLVFDADKATQVIREVISELESMIGFKIEEVILNIPSYEVDFSLVKGKTLVQNDNMEVTGKEITSVLKDALSNKVEKDRDLVSMVPINFILDEKEGIEDPKGLVGSTLEVKGVMVTTVKKLVYSFINVVEKAGLKVVDINFSSLADYYEFSSSKTNAEVGAIINIGHDITTVSVFNKGIMVASDVFALGGRNITRDLSYIYKIENNEAEKLKKSFATASKKIADSDNFHEIFSTKGDALIINQYEISEVVIARLEEIFKIAKTKLNDLTKKEISYIIVTGGASEILGMDKFVKEQFEAESKIGVINTLGIRHNKYSACIGSIKYFNDKLRLRGKKHSMIEELDEGFTGRVKKSNETVLNKIFGYFLDS